MNPETALVRGRDARASLPAPTLRLAAGRQHTAQSILDAWKAGKSENTLSGYWHDLADFADYLSHALNIRPAMTIEAALTKLFQQSSPSAHEIVLAFRHHLREPCGMASSSVNRHLATLRSVAKLARQLGLCDWLLEVPGVKLETRKDTTGPTIDQINAVLATLDGHTEADVRNRAILITLFGSALRVSELTGLQYADVDLVHRRAWITAKGKREKVLIELPDQTVAAIRQYLTFRGTGPGQLFRSLPNRARSREGFGTRSARKVIRSLFARIGVVAWPHAIRHSAITTALEAGAKQGLSIYDVQQFSRHASIATVQHYLDGHNAAAAKRQITDLVGAKVRPGDEFR